MNILSFILGAILGWLINGTDTPKKQERGFRVMNKDLQREIASKGGKAAQESGVAHRWDEKEAREAGSKGGVSVSQDKEHMKRIGSLGGKKSKRKPKLDGSKQDES
jgi:uncharacterized protein